MLRIVLDTNEYISGVIKKQSNPAKIIQAWREGEIDLLISPSIKEEIERVISLTLSHLPCHSERSEGLRVTGSVNSYP